MTKEEIAKQYLRWLEEDNSELGIQRVVNSLDSLLYSKSKVPVSKEFKLSIVAEMEQLTPGHGAILEHADNKAILLLIQTVKAIIENEKGE